MRAYEFSNSPLGHVLAWISDLGDLAWPFILFVACMAWSWRSRSVLAFGAAAAALLFVAERVVRPLGLPVTTLSYCSGLSPDEGESSFVFIFRSYGRDVGLLLIALCLFSYFVFKRKRRSVLPANPVSDHLPHPAPGTRFPQ